MRFLRVFAVNTLMPMGMAFVIWALGALFILFIAAAVLVFASVGRQQDTAWTMKVEHVYWIVAWIAAALFGYQLGYKATENL